MVGIILIYGLILLKIFKLYISNRDINILLFNNNKSYINAIEIIDDGSHDVYPGIRLLGSIIVSNGNSIFNSVTLPPITVSTQPSSANSMVSAGVNIIPATALLVDPAVF